MGMIARIKALWAARANKALDKMESSDLSGLLEVSLNEEKQHIQDAEKALNELGGQVKTMQQDVTTLEHEVADWQHNAETALNKGNEDLAKQALSRQTTVEQELDAKKKALAVLMTNHAKLTQDILDREEKARDMTAKLATLRAEEKTADVVLQARKTVGAHAGDGNAMNQMGEMERRIQAKLNTVEAAEEFDEKASGADVDRQFADMHKASAVDDKLAALKAKVAGQKPSA